MAQQQALAAQQSMQQPEQQPVQQQPYQQMPPPPEPAAGPTPDQLMEAKKMLGLDAVEAANQQNAAILQQMQQDAMMQQMSAKYPDVPADKVQEEIARIEKEDPALAAAMLNSKGGVETVFKALKADMQPPAKPDDTTDSADNGGEDPLDTIGKKLKDGKKVSHVELGQFIIG